MAASTSNQASTADGVFVTVPGDRHAEVARTLAGPVASWMTASILSFGVAAAVTPLAGAPDRRQKR